MNLQTAKGALLTGLVLGVVLLAVFVVWHACAVRTPPPAPGRAAPPPAPGREAARRAPADEASAIQDLRARRLEFPVAGALPSDLRDSFDEARGSRVHEAVDIPAPRGAPVRAVEDGTIAKLYQGAAGGISVYQFDAGERYCYYYAHLQRYAPGLREGQQVRRSEVIGFVGTTGNAPESTPHLHFAIFRLDEGKQWWRGTPVNPLPVLR
jgi:murein DD-endopeptidase MepM/ murein hydrolase activator NlpD